MIRSRPWALSGAVAVLGCALAGETPPAGAPQEKPAAAVDSRPAGPGLYARHCLSCHQADGWGVPNMQPPIVGGTWVKGDPKALALFVMTGGFDSAQRKEGVTSHNVMPPFRQLSDEDLAGILNYIREKFGGGASAVTPALVAEARATLPPS